MFEMSLDGASPERGKGEYKRNEVVGGTEALGWLGCGRGLRC